MIKYLRTCVFLLLVLAGNTYAIPVTMQFTVAGFSPVIFSNAAPTDPVTGTIVWDAASASSPINSLSSINLTLDGHTYTLGEVGFISPFGGGDIIGGTAAGLASMSSLSDDFFIIFSVSLGTPTDFTYASSKLEGAWSVGRFTQFSITANSVPEPATHVLFGLGLAALGFSSRKSKKA